MLDPTAHTIHIESMYGARSGKPIVQISWGALQAQLTPSEAIAHAVRVIQVAANAEADADFVKFLQKQFGLSLEAVGPALIDFRKHRMGP